MAGKKGLTALQVDKLGPGSYTDEANLILRVKPTGARSWVFRYQSGGKIAEIGLGKAGKNERGLAEARELAAQMRAAVRNGVDPKTVLKPKHDPAAMTFKVYAGHYIDYLRATPRNGKTRNDKAVEQWPSTLEKWVYPHIGDKRPADITYRDVQAVLTQKGKAGAKGLADLPETQKRVRQRIKVILDEAAKEENEPHRYNPALSFKLESRPHDSVKHHAAAPWQDVPTIMASLRKKASTSALLLRFSILTAARSGEARGALWSEIDLDAATWTLPKERMKAGRLHRVPLCEEAIAILKVMAERKHVKSPERVFPGAQGGLISDVAINKTLHAAAAGVTAHGFRSSFRQWVAEATSFSPEAAELALAHTPKDKVQAAYQRSDLFDARKIIMKAWGDFVVGKKNVVQLATTA